MVVPSRTAGWRLPATALPGGLVIIFESLANYYQIHPLGGGLFLWCGKSFNLYSQFDFKVVL